MGATANDASHGIGWKTHAGILSAADLAAIAETLERGGVVAVPTETYYGLAAHWRRPQAIQTVYALKGRPAATPLLLLVAGIEMAARLVPEAPAQLAGLAEVFWPGPLTIAVTAPPNIDPRLIGPTGGVALRHSPHPVLQQLLDRLDCPLTGSSANRSGCSPASRVADIRLAEQGILAGVVDAGPTAGGGASTLIDLTDPTAPRLVRRGPIGADRIQKALGSRLV